MLTLDRIPVRIRLSLGHAIWMAFLFAGIGIGLHKIVKTNLLNSVDIALMSSAKSAREARFNQSQSPAEVFFKHFLGKEIRTDDFFENGRINKPYAQLITVSGKVRAKTDNIPARLPVTALAVARAEKGISTFETFKIGEKRLPLRQVTLPVLSKKGKFTGDLVQVGTSLESIHQTLKGITFALSLALPLGLTLSILIGYLLAAKALKPVRQIRSTASKLGIDDLSMRLTLPPADDELRELTSTFNSMLDRLEEAVKRLRRFTGDVSHELRTPLAVLRGEAEFALRKMRSPDDYRESLQTIATESIHMTKIIEDLLLLARAESQSVAMNWVDTQPSQFIKELQSTVETIFSEKNISLSVDCTMQESFVSSYTYYLLAVKNILINAAKHSPENSTVSLVLKKVESDVVLSIRDEGEGIPKESLPYIFDSFFRADTARNRKAGGVGIGLSLARALIKLHNGKISVKSKVGDGTIFEITIPINRDTPDTPEESVAKSKGALSISTQSPKTILS